jgi:predicted dehydrogenase
MSPKKTFKVLALSLVKHSYIVRALIEHPRYELVAVADDSDQADWIHTRNQSYADEFNIPYLKNIEEAISTYDIDVAVVSSEIERHCELSVIAANYGVHVIQDKPMSMSVTECDRVVEAVKRNNVKFMMWNRNFLPAVLQAHNIIQSGDIGDVYAIHVDFYFAKDAGPAKGSRSPDDPPMDWLEALKAAHRDGSDGGVGKDAVGELAVEGIYPLAYINMLLGSGVKQVYAKTASHFHQLHADNSVDDLATVSLKMLNGASASICLGRIGAASHPDIGEIKLHILGSKGSLVISEARPEIAVYYRGQPSSEFKYQRTLAFENDYLLADNFSQAIDNDTKTILNAQTSRDIAITTAAALESASSGTLIDL